MIKAGIEPALKQTSVSCAYFTLFYHLNHDTKKAFIALTTVSNTAVNSLKEN